MARDRSVLPFFYLGLWSFILRTGSVAEQMGDLEHAATAYENALRHNPMSIPGLTQVAGIARIKENYPMVRSFSSFATSLGLNRDD